MAVHHPCARVVCLESKRQPAVGRKHSSVPTGGVVVVEVVDVTVLPSLLTGSEDVEVVAVQVNRVGNLDVVRVSRNGANDPVDPFTLGGELDDAGAIGEAVHLVVLYVVKGRLLPVGVQRCTVDVPVESQGTIGSAGLVEPGVEGSHVVSDLTGWDVRVPVRSEALLVGAALGVLATLADRGLGLVALVREDGQNVAVHGVVTATGLVLDLSAEPVATSGLVSVDDHIVALTDTEEDPVGGVRNNGNKVGGDDLHLVTVQRDHEVVVDGHVDETDTVLLVLLQGGPLVLASIDIVVGSGGTLNNDRTNETIAVLAREVRVVPRSTVLSSLESVGLLLARCDRALGDTGNTILSVLAIDGDRASGLQCRC